MIILPELYASIIYLIKSLNDNVHKEKVNLKRSANNEADNLLSYSHWSIYMFELQKYK